MRTGINFITAGVAGLALVLFVAACGRDGQDTGGPGPTVVATTTHAGDLTRAVAGERADVITILSPTADPHEYEPRPSDAEALADASLVVESGGEIDAWIADLIESAGSDAERVVLLDEAPTRLPDDPHWWQDPLNAAAAVDAIASALGDIDPDGARDYATAASAYTGELRRLDREIARCIDSIPAARRKLVTSHDSLRYFAERYGIEITGSTIPALTTQAQPSSGEIAELVDLIEAQDVAAVFPEAGASTELEEAVAEETGAAVGEELHADALAPEGSPASTYAGALRANARAIGAGLGGDPARCRLEG